MKKILLLLCLPATFMVGCVVTSIYPFYTEKDLIFEPSLVGEWIENAENDSSQKEPNEVWEFSKAGEPEYEFKISTSNETNVFSAHLFKLGGQRFLDWRAAVSPDGFIPPHYLLKVREISSTLLLEPMSESWLEDLLKKNPDAVRHMVLQEKSGDSTSERIVLTADTKELQKFVLKHINDTNAFGDKPIDLKPRKNFSAK